MTALPMFELSAPQATRNDVKTRTLSEAAHKAIKNISYGTKSGRHTRALYLEQVTPEVYAEIQRVFSTLGIFWNTAKQHHLVTAEGMRALDEERTRCERPWQLEHADAHAYPSYLPPFDQHAAHLLTMADAIVAAVSDAKKHGSTE